MLSAEVINRLFSEEDILGLKFAIGVTAAVAYFKIKTVEMPITLKSYALGATDGGVTGRPAVAQSTIGTGWDEIKDTASRNWLEPDVDNVVFQIFYGVAPSYAQIFQRFPSNVDRLNLIGAREIGGKVGAISGFDSPFRNPSALTEFFTLRGTFPAFFGFNPNVDVPGTLIHLNFFVSKLGVEYLGYEGHPRVQPTEEQVDKAVIRTMGGSPPVPLPQWLRT